MNDEQKKRVLGALADVDRISARLKSTFARDLSGLYPIEQRAIQTTAIETLLIAMGHCIAMIGMSQILNPISRQGKTDNNGGAND